MIFLIIIALALLKYFFDWSIFDAASSEEGKGTILYVRDILNTIWSYLAAPLHYIWNEVIWPLLTFVFSKSKA